MELQIQLSLFVALRLKVLKATVPLSLGGEMGAAPT